MTRCDFTLRTLVHSARSSYEIAYWPAEQLLAGNRMSLVEAITVRLEGIGSIILQALNLQKVS